MVAIVKSAVFLVWILSPWELLLYLLATLYDQRQDSNLRHTTQSCALTTELSFSGVGIEPTTAAPFADNLYHSLSVY